MELQKPVIFCQSNSIPSWIDDIMQELDLPRVESVEGYESWLEYSNGCLKFDSLKLQKSKINPISFDFVAQWQRHLSNNYSLKKEPMAKAIGITGNKDILVWDITCGTGKDSILLLAFGGTKVIAFERNPIIYALLRDALGRALMDSKLGPVMSTRFELYSIDPTKSDLNRFLKPSVIYYDPMYSKEKKSALPRREMQIFQNVLVGEDSDSAEVLRWALQYSLDRVVVKRPLYAPPIIEGVTAEYKGKSTRYDMWKCF